MNCISRRQAIKVSAAVTALPLVHIRTAGAAGKLAVAYISSFVPGWNEAFQRLIETWGKRNAVAVQVDFLSATTGQFLVTPAAEAQARAGHDVMYFQDYYVATYAAHLEPVDDLVTRLVAAYGPPSERIEYLAKIAGTWRATPTSMFSLNFPCESRIDVFRDKVGVDLKEVFPLADAMGPGYDQWTWDAFLIAAEKCLKAGVPFGLPISNCTDANSWLAALFTSFGARFVDAKGNVVVRSDPMREALDYLKRLGQRLPPDVYTWDNASNNRALISGKSAMIINPPSAWAGAVKENPAVGAQIWHHPLPAGEHGRFLTGQPAFMGIWKFSPNKSAAKDLIAWLGEREQVEASLIASQGYDVPVFPGLRDFPIWAELGPPKGTLFNYPLRAAHHATPIVAGAPAPLTIAGGISAQWVLPKLAGRVMQAGMPIEAAIAETERDLAGIIGR